MDVEKLLAENLKLQQQMAKILSATAAGSSESKHATTGSKGVSIEKYDEEDNFEEYVERLEAFFTIQNVTDKVNTFITLLSPKIYSLLKGLIYPSTFKEKTYEQLKFTLQSHLSPKPLIIPSRHEFINRKQRDGETVSQYITALRKLAVNCDYDPATLKIMLRDVFVSGLSSKEILDRLFEENDPDLEKTIKIALAIEKALLSTKEILHNSISNGLVNKVELYKRKENFSENKGKVQCFRCGKTNHKAPKCRGRNLHCKKCGKDGHLASVCFSSTMKTSNTPKFPLKHLETDTINTETEHEINMDKVLSLNSLYKSKRQDDLPAPIFVTVCIHGKPLELELDTGSVVTVINCNTFVHTLQIPRDTIEPTDLKFRCYNQEMMSPLGKANVEVSHAGKSLRLTLYIVKDSTSSILGRDWIQKLEILNLNLNQVEAALDNKKDLLLNLFTKYNHLFSDKIGKISNYVCDLKLKENCTPVFQKARQVPFALMEKVEKELNRLEEDGIIEKTEFSEWATPIVPVVKTDGTIRICGDYSKTVNLATEVAHHPLPSLEEILTKVSGSTIFATLDLKSAYLHLPVSEHTSQILTINTHKGLYKVLRMMYGINVAPAKWQRYIESILHGLPGVIVFFDDILISATSGNELLTRIENVFTELSKNDLKLNRNKCKFFLPAVTYLGYKISKNGLEKTKEKIDSILKCKTPTNVTELKSFMDLVTFYAQFIPNLSTISYPLNKLTKKNSKFKGRL